jgi:LuxR family transcriptional regulator/LuxR family quorum-sensing system transcriptional regulator CciR
MAMFQTTGKEFDRANDLDEIWHEIISFACERGYTSAFYLHLPPAGLAGLEPVLYRGGCELTADYMADQTYLVDPFVMHGLQATEPFLLRDIERHRALSDAERAFRALAQAHGCADGIGLPVFGPTGRSGYLELNMEPGHTMLPDEEAARTHWLAQQAHLRICALVEERASRQRLTPREREILAWLARGKSNDVIGRILGLSPHTIDTYLRRIYEKLGVCDRVSAALRGVAEGHITGIAPRPVTRARLHPRVRAEPQDP